MKKILFILTGGTLASTDSESGLRPGLKSDDIFKDINGMAKNYTVTFKELWALDSANVQPEEWQTLAEVIYENSKIYDGIVVNHLFQF